MTLRAQALSRVSSAEIEAIELDPCDESCVCSVCCPDDEPQGREPLRVPLARIIGSPVRVEWREFHADPRAVARRTRDASRVVVHDDAEVLFEIVRQSEDL